MKYYDILAVGEARQTVKEFGFSKFDKDVVVLSPEETDSAYRRDELVFVTASNSLDKNKKIVRLPIDGIVDPFFPRASPFDKAMLTVARDNDLVIVITLSKFLSTRGIDRARLIVKARRLIALAHKERVPIVISSKAEHPFELRTPFQLVNLGIELGMTAEKARWAISKVPEALRRKK